MKNCSRKTCTQINPQPIESFSPDKTKKDGFHAECKVCNNLAQKKRMENPENKAKKKIYDSSDKVKVMKEKYHLKIRYGITFGVKEELFDKQNGICAIEGCETSLALSGRTTHVDHNHKSGKIRGLLCSNCNHALGKIRDNVEIAKGLAKYLEKNL